ncbi:glutamine amidotransferase [Pseudomonas sp. AD21]|jgi:putative glutamine amidotransferase|uniref:glutamine amidotransferase n=1 Tax=unclassified Pseudomonas TaxID=196821 RepID=UPI0011AFC287|nr:glutamine amidotransferase [Pseudomonas sp. AD21]MDX9671649.1 glutamine amidotransferase [Pseudomonas sp. P8_250]WPN34378.1 glutamine amidotransferase [Pseudomonas sp. P8_139]WPN43823.1 glutamine amidotransferase [Pseudomonas sp. P8_229]
MSRLPLIGITDCSQQSGLHAQHISGDKSVHSAASKARDLSTRFSSAAGRTAASVILDVRQSILFMASPSNIDLFESQSLCRFSSRARDSARLECAQEMQRQRKGQVSSSFIVDARCRA